MQQYRVYKLNPVGKITCGEWIEALDDREACAKAHALCDEMTPSVELWLRATRIAVLPCEDDEGPPARH